MFKVLKTCHLVTGVDDPKTCQVETTVQLPTSSSSAEKPGNYIEFG